MVGSLEVPKGFDITALNNFYIVKDFIYYHFFFPQKLRSEQISTWPRESQPEVQKSQMHRTCSLTE